MFNNSGTQFTMPVMPAGNGGGYGNGFGNDGWGWIWILLIFAVFSGWGGNGLFGGMGGANGAAQNYILSSDFATIQRQLSDGFNSIDNALDRQNAGICDLGYTSLNLNNQTNTRDIIENQNNTNMAIMQGNNALATQLADCCCKTQSGIERINTGNAMNTAAIQASIKDCCCENEKATMQTRYDMASQNCATLQAIDKLGDRIIDRMTQSEMAAKDARIAEQARTINNQYLLSQINRTPIPAYVVQNPYCQCNNGYPFGFGGTTIA